MADDFSVAEPRDWPTVAVVLLGAVSRAAQERGAAQVVVVTAQLDEAAKRAVLAASGLSVASEWWVRPLNAE